MQIYEYLHVCTEHIQVHMYTKNFERAKNLERALNIIYKVSKHCIKRLFISNKNIFNIHIRCEKKFVAFFNVI